MASSLSSELAPDLPSELAWPEPVPFLDQDGVEIPCARVLRLAGHVTAPLPDAAVDLAEKLPVGQAGQGTLVGYDREFWWPLDDSTGDLLLLELLGTGTVDMADAGMAAGAPGNDAPAWRPADPGWVYVMRPLGMASDIYKVGKTARDPDVRARELSASTSALEFVVVQAWPVSHMTEAERTVHKALAAYRLSPRREMFRCPYDVMRGLIDNTLKGLALPSAADPGHPGQRPHRRDADPAPDAIKGDAMIPSPAQEGSVGEGPVVVNRHVHYVPGPDDEDRDRYVFITRPSRWSNPFRVGADGTKADVLRKYKEWLVQQIRDRAISLEDLAALKDKHLVCVCDPKPCHGHILAVAVRWAVKQLARQRDDLAPQTAMERAPDQNL